MISWTHPIIFFRIIITTFVAQEYRYHAIVNKLKL